MPSPPIPLLHLVASRGVVFVADIAEDLAVTHKTANAKLRALEREGVLEAELAGGGRLRYALSERGRALASYGGSPAGARV